MSTADIWAWCAAANHQNCAPSCNRATKSRRSGAGGFPSIWGRPPAELVRSHAAGFINDPDRLAGLAAATALIVATLPEREPHADIYALFAKLLTRSIRLTMGPRNM